MDDERYCHMIDGLPKDAANETLPHQMSNLHINTILDDLTIQEYKSIFFLLMDYVNEDDFINITKQDTVYLKGKLEDILKTINGDNVLQELFYILKMFKKLRLCHSCQHIYKDLEQRKLGIIDGVWRMLYSLCEELTDDDLESFKQTFPDDIKKQITTAEDWFYWALKQNIFSKTDFSKLEIIFHNYPDCLEIIKNFVKPESYNIRTPTENIACGIAVIFNFEEFDKIFAKRIGSTVDANSLKAVWSSFGFITDIHNNLTYDETVKKLEEYAALDHSDYDIFVCCILSHGFSNSIITKDGEEMHIPFLISKITDKSESLNTKPKLFFIQACQGTDVQQGFGEPIYQSEPVQKPKSNKADFSTHPIMDDVLLAISTIDGYVSFRNPVTGSWFIDAFCKVMKQKGDKLSILEIMLEVNSMVRKRSHDFGPGSARNAQQIVKCTYTFRKNLNLKKKK